MRKLASSFLVVMFACVLAMCVGCSSQSSSSASQDAASSAASAQASTDAALDPANLADGEYSAEVEMQGGSGKASIESPAKLIVTNGEIQAVIVWSSPNYDLMIVDGTEYKPVPRQGNSTFEIPIAGFDQDLPVKAETTAMSEPHMIDYTFNFSSASLKAWES